MYFYYTEVKMFTLWGYVHCILENLTDNFTKKIAKIVMSFGQKGGLNLTFEHISSCKSSLALLDAFFSGHNHPVLSSIQTLASEGKPSPVVNGDQESELHVPFRKKISIGVQVAL